MTSPVSASWMTTKPPSGRETSSTVTTLPFSLTCGWMDTVAVGGDCSV